jgi:hypothetical protein
LEYCCVLLIFKFYRRKCEFKSDIEQAMIWGAFLIYPGGTHGKIQAPGFELIAGKEAICFLAS